MESAGSATTLEIVNAALAKAAAEPKSYKGKELAELKRYHNPVLMADGPFRCMVFVFTDKTMTIERFDPVTAEAFEATDIPNSGKTDFKRIKASLAHEKGRYARFVNVDNILQFVTGKCTCRKNRDAYGKNRDAFRKIYPLIPMNRLGVGASLRVERYYKAESRSRRQSQASAEGGISGTLSTLVALSALRDASSPKSDSAPISEPPSGGAAQAARQSSSLFGGLMGSLILARVLSSSLAEGEPTKPAEGGPTKTTEQAPTGPASQEPARSAGQEPAGPASQEPAGEQ